MMIRTYVCTYVRKRGSLFLSGHTSLVIKDDEIWNKFKQRLRVEGKTDHSEVIFGLIDKDNVEHDDGNPGFKLDQWIKDHNFLAVPALFSDEKKIRKFMLKSKDDKNWDRLGAQINVWASIYNEIQEQQANQD